MRRGATIGFDAECPGRALAKLLLRIGIRSCNSKRYLSGNSASDDEVFRRLFGGTGDPLPLPRDRLTVYRLPKDFDPRDCVGLTLEQVCFNENPIWFHVDRRNAICVESALSHREPGDSRHPQLMEVPVTNSNLMRLLGQRVVDAGAMRRAH